MRLCFTSILFLLSTLFLHSQSIVKGQLVDETGEPLAYANVLLLQVEDSTLLQGVITDEAGLYTLKDVTQNQYLLSFTMIGYEPLYYDINVNNSLLDHGVSRMQESVAQLDAVEVKAKRPLFEQQIDRMVVNVEHSITSAGGTALEILEKSPGVFVNRQSNAIAMAGKEGVIVMINGKESRMPPSALLQMLNGMPADNIEKIELIATPPAQFDAEGNAGYINIVLKRNRDEGVNSSITLIGGYARGERYGGNVNLDYRAGRLGIFAGYGFMFDRTPQIWNSYRSLESDGVTISNNTNSLRKSTQRDHNYRLGFDYAITTRTTIGALFAGYDNRWEMNAFNEARISSDGQLDTLLEIDNYEVNHWKHQMANINLRHEFNNNTSLTLDGDYLYTFNSNPSDYNNLYQDSEKELFYQEQVRSINETPINIYVGRADFTTSLGQSIKLSSGIKGTLSRFDNNVSVERQQQNGWEFDPELTQNFNFEEKVGAAYTSLDIQLSQKADMQLGLRYEYTDSYLSSAQQEGIVDRTYGNFFPSVFMAYDFNEHNRAQLSYSRRIRRPGFREMAPFVLFIDPNTFFTGNPALQPSISDALKIDYKYQKYFISAQYSYDDGAIARYQPTIDSESNRQFFNSQNMDYRQTANISLTLPFYPNDWWEMQNSLSGTWQKNRTSVGNELATLEQKSVNIFSSQSFSLPADFSMEVSGFYSSPLLFGNSKTEAFGTLNFGIEKEFSDNNGKLRFSILDILQTNVYSINATIPENNVQTNVYIRYQNRTYRLTYSRNFGNNKVKTSRQRETGSEAEQQRVN